HGRRSFARRPGNVADAANHPGEPPTRFRDHFLYHWVGLEYTPPLTVRRAEPPPPPPHSDSQRYKHELKCYFEEARARAKHEHKEARARAKHGNSRAGAATAVIEAPAVATESVPVGTVFAGVYTEV